METSKGQRPFFHTYKKNDLITGCATDVSDAGYGVVKVDGFVCFVKNLMVGECAQIHLLKVEKTYGYGKVTSFINQSNHRVNPVCPIVDQCGGCQIMHFDAVAQAAFKQDVVIKAMSQIAQLEVEVQPILIMNEPFHYRNKVSVPVKIDDRVHLGFYRQHSHDIVDVETCYVQSKHQNQILQWFRQFLEKHPIPSIRHIVLKENQQQELMVGFVTTIFPFPYQQALVDGLINEFDFVVSVVASVKTKKDNVILGEKEVVLAKAPILVDKGLGLEFEISLHSFYQINPTQTQVLYEQVRKLANIQAHETVLDLYCGIGTIGLVCAQDAKQVIGFEINKKAVADAKRNAKRNQLDNAEFFAMDASEARQHLIKTNQKADVLIVDPPRAGLEKKVIADIIEMNPKRMVYVSCNPSTCARDLVLLTEQYRIETIQPVDMFPQTVHVETVVLITRK